MDDPALAEFVRLYRAGRFFDAHEALEVVWRRSREPRMLLLQGLIQLAVAFEHQRRGNHHGALRQLDKALPKIAAGPPGDLGLDLAAVRAAAPALREAFARADAGERVPPQPAPPIGLRPDAA